MSLNHSKKISFVAIILLVALATVISYAESPSKKSNSEKGRTMSNTKNPEILENHIQFLNDRVQKLEDKEKPSKDLWDKFASVSTFLSGVIIALIGIYATSVYNQRQLDSQNIQKEREISVLRVQTVEKFFGHLASEDQSIRRAALDSIAALGDEELAARLAKHFGGESGVAVLASLSKSNNPVVAQNASKALSELFSSLQQSVIVIKSGEPTTSLSTGFFVSSDGLVLVPSFALSKEPFFIEIPRIGKSFLAEVIKRDDQKHLALLKIKLTDPVVPIGKFSNKIELGDQVVALGYAGASGWISTVGRITGNVKGHTGSNRIASNIETKPGMAGAPVVNTKGQLVGIAESKDAQGTRLLIPAIDVKEFLKIGDVRSERA